METSEFLKTHPEYARRVYALARKLDNVVRESGLSHLTCPCCGSTAALAYDGAESEFLFKIVLTPGRDIADFEVDSGDRSGESRAKAKTGFTGQSAEGPFERAAYGASSRRE